MISYAHNSNITPINSVPFPLPRSPHSPICCLGPSAAHVRAILKSCTCEDDSESAPFLLMDSILCSSFPVPVNGMPLFLLKAAQHSTVHGTMTRIQLALTGNCSSCKAEDSPVMRAGKMLLQGDTCQRW